jgi:RNase P protein component
MVRESFRLMLPELQPGSSIVVNVMRAAATAPYASVDAQLRDIFKKAGLFKSHEDKIFADGSDSGARQ